MSGFEVCWALLFYIAKWHKFFSVLHEHCKCCLFFDFVIKYIGSHFLREDGKGEDVMEVQCPSYTLHRVTICYPRLQDTEHLPALAEWTQQLL